MLNLEVDLLRAFVAVADTGGFTNAARHLHRTQSAVSMQVRRLEETVGSRVFDRNGRAVKLTGKGEILLSHARRMLRINEEAVSELVTPTVEGRVRLGIPDGYGTYFLPRLLSSFSQAHPRVQLEVVCEMTAEMLAALAADDLDLALVVRDPAYPAGEVLWSESIVWAGSEEQLVHEEDPLPLALFPQGCVLRARALRALDTSGRRWRIAYCSPSLAAVQAAVLAGLGVAVLGASTLLPRMRALGPDEQFPPLPSSEIELHTAPGEPSEVATRLSEHIVQQLRQPALNR